MNLYLMRHGIAAARDDAAADAERPLTRKGTKRTRRIAKGMRRLGLSFDVVLTSPLARARQTADIVAATLGAEALVEEMPALSPENTVEQLLSGLNSYRERGDLLLVGHEPLLSSTVSHLLGGKATRAVLNIKFKKGGLCRIEVDALPLASPGTFHWLLTPQQLRLIGGSR